MGECCQSIKRSMVLTVAIAAGAELACSQVCDKVWDKIKDEAAGKTVEYVQELVEINEEGCTFAEQNGNLVAKVSEAQVASYEGSILIPFKKVVWASYGTHQTIDGVKVIDKLKDVVEDYETNDGTLNVLNIKKIHNELNGFSDFFGDPDFFAVNQVLEIH